MVSRRLRTVIVVLLLLITVGLAGVAIYIGRELRQGGEKAPEETEAASNWTALYATSNCQNGGCTCNADGGCQINWYRCDDKYPLTTNAANPTAVQPCLKNVKYAGNMSKGETASYQQLLGDDSVKCTYIQIDLDPKDGMAGNGLAGAAIIVWNNNALCLPACSYNSTEALVKESESDSWSSTLAVTCGDSVIVGSSHNQDTSSYPDNTKLTIKLPDDTEVDATNGESFQTTTEGTYTLTVQTMRANGTTPYTEAKCNASAIFTCESDQGGECGDGVLNTGEECETGIACSNPAEICDETTCSCSAIQTEVQCEEMARVDNDPVGQNEVELFTVRVSGDPDTQPYATSQVKLRVSSSADDTAVGEDYFTSEDLVSPVSSPGYSPDDGAWIYTFAWRASGLVNGTYDVEVSFDNGSTWDDTSACVLTFTYNEDEEVEPSFLIVKTSSPTCSTANGAVINYTLTVTNLGPTSGVIEFVEDELDTGIQASWVSNISSSRGVTGVLSGNTITWTGTETQRTFAVAESETYTYRVTIPSSSLQNFTADGVPNKATVEFYDNQTVYHLVTPLNCTGTLPSTGIMDNTPWLIGTFAIILGIIALKIGPGKEILYPVIRNSKFATLYAIGFDSLAADTKKKEMEKKYRDSQRF